MGVAELLVMATESFAGQVLPFPNSTAGYVPLNFVPWNLTGASQNGAPEFHFLTTSIYSEAKRWKQETRSCIHNSYIVSFGNTSR